MLAGLRDGSTALIYTIARTQIREQAEGRA